MPDEQVAIMLEKYCRWLNKWVQEWDKDPEGKYHKYTPKQFTVNDPDKGLYGSMHITARYRTTWYDCVSIEVYDGDEGGHTQLTAYFRDGVLRHMIQEFDTEIQFVYKDNQWENLP